MGVSNYDQLGLHDHQFSVFSADEHAGAGVIIKFADVVITTAEVLTLTTPETVVPAPGANRVNIFKGALLFLDYNSAAYVTQTDDDLQFKYTDASGAAVSPSIEARGFIDQTNDEYIYAPPITSAGVVPVANAAIVLDNTGANFATGNSPLYVRTWYEQWDLSSLGQTTTSLS